VNKPFENDAARDWLIGLLAAPDDHVLRNGLASDDPHVVIAAAEIVAGIAGEAGWELPPEVRDWSEAQHVDVGPLLPLARDAVARVNHAPADDMDTTLLLTQLERRLGTA
jgi:hypothetical protein